MVAGARRLSQGAARKPGRGSLGGRGHSARGELDWWQWQVVEGLPAPRAEERETHNRVMKREVMVRRLAREMRGLIHT